MKIFFNQNILNSSLFLINLNDRVKVLNVIASDSLMNVILTWQLRSHTLVHLCDVLEVRICLPSKKIKILYHN